MDTRAGAISEATDAKSDDDGPRLEEAKVDLTLELQGARRH
jgi:hypothetical protein